MSRNQVIVTEAIHRVPDTTQLLLKLILIEAPVTISPSPLFAKGKGNSSILYKNVL